MKEAAQVLLQTIPDSIDIEDFQKQILQKFPEIESIHDLHIWQLTQQKFVSTAHMIFMDPPVYKTIINDVLGFFHEQGINIVTIQPEFKHGAEMAVEEIKPLVNSNDICLFACRKADCEEKRCCRRASEESINAHQLEQVTSVSNISAEELNTISNFTSAKSLNYQESENSMHSDHAGPHKKRSTASLNNPSSSRHKHKIQKSISTIDREHEHIPATSDCDGIHLISIKKFVSESVIKSGDHDDLGRHDSEILVENRMMKQLDTTDNNEMENLYDKCDR